MARSAAPRIAKAARNTPGECLGEGGDVAREQPSSEAVAEATKRYHTDYGMKTEYRDAQELSKLGLLAAIGYCFVPLDRWRRSHKMGPRRWAGCMRGLCQFGASTWGAAR